MIVDIGEKIAVIPARGGSKGLPGKNIRLFCGKPLITWTIKAAIQSACFSRVLVTTDCEKIAAVAQDAGAEVPFIRPPQYATDSATTVDTVIHLCDALQLEDNDWICLLQPTSPLRDANLIKKSVQHIGANSVVSVNVFKLGADWLLRQDTHGNLAKPKAQASTSRQTAVPHYYPNGSIYWIELKGLRRNKSFFAEPIFPFVVPTWQSMDIDSLEDFIVAEIIKNSEAKIREVENIDGL